MVKYFGLMLGIIIVQRLVELWLAEHNRAIMMAKGAREYGESHYPMFFVLHVGWILCLFGEVALWGTDPNLLWPWWLALYLIAQVLRYWCIITLKQFWNTRIIVLPGAQAVETGPYRYCRHPNYLAVSIELVSVSLIFNAWVTAILASGLNLWLLLFVRIPMEEHALRLLNHSSRSSAN